MQMKLQFFGGRGSAGGNARASAESAANTTATATKSERVSAAKAEVESGKSTSAASSKEKTTKSAKPVKFKPASTKATSEKRIDTLTNSLTSSNTLVGTKGNTTYVVEADKIRTTYTRPNGVRVPASRTVYTITPFVKGRNSADSKTFRSQEELNNYMKNTGATWKSRKTRLSNKQKDNLF